MVKRRIKNANVYISLHPYCLTPASAGLGVPDLPRYDLCGQICDVFIQSGDNDIPIGKQTAVDIRKCGQIVVHIGVSGFRLCIQYPKHVHKSASGIVLVSLHIVVEFAMTAENLRILGVQTEYQPNTQGVQTFQCLRGLRVFVLLQKSIIQDANDFAGL